MSKVIVFDFDGTLADSSTLLRCIYNDMATTNGWPAMSEADYQRLRHMRIGQVQKWAGIKSWQVPGLMRDGLKRFRSLAGEIAVFEGIPELIKQLSAEDTVLYVLSTNSKAAITDVLKRFEIVAQVTILKRSALFGKHHALRHLIAKNKYDPSNVWMVGDEVRDIEAAKRAGVKSAAVTWGLQDADLLKTANPDLIAANPSELRAIFKN